MYEILNLEDYEDYLHAKIMNTSTMYDDASCQIQIMREANKITGVDEIKIMESCFKAYLALIRAATATIEGFVKKCGPNIGNYIRSTYFYLRKIEDERYPILKYFRTKRNKIFHEGVLEKIGTNSQQFPKVTLFAKEQKVNICDAELSTYILKDLPHGMVKMDQLFVLKDGKTGETHADKEFPLNDDRQVIMCCDYHLKCTNEFISRWIHVIENRWDINDIRKAERENEQNK